MTEATMEANQILQKIESLEGVLKQAFDLIDVHITTETLYMQPQNCTPTSPDYEHILELGQFAPAAPLNGFGTRINPKGIFPLYKEYLPSLFETTKELEIITIQQYAQRLVDAFQQDVTTYIESGDEPVFKWNPVHKRTTKRAIFEGLLYHNLGFMFLTKTNTVAYHNPKEPELKQKAQDANQFIWNSYNIMEQFMKKTT